MKKLIFAILLILSSVYIGCDRNSDNSNNVNNNTNNTNNINNTNNTNNVNNQSCGNGIIDEGEICDGTNLGNNDCTTLELGYTEGTLSCLEDCSDFDVSECSYGENDSHPTPDATILQTGTGGFLLKGKILLEDSVISQGEVLIVNEFITCVDTSCSNEPEVDSVTIIETNGIISPGLIDSHNHVSYNFLPEWVPSNGQLFNNRYEWADDPEYEEFIKPYTAHRSSNSHFCPASKWGILRSLVHGTTTMQGQPSASGSCINWSVRNANRYHGLGHDHMRGTIASPRDITTADASNYIESFEEPTEPCTRLHVHMQEGFSGNHITEEFDSFAGRDPRENRHAGVSLLEYGTAILIHSVSLTNLQIEEAALTDAKIVWSPSSNMVLYGETAPIDLFLEAGITVGIGPDWTLSGEDDMLGELKFCREYALSTGISLLSSKKLWQMATIENAKVIGLEDHIGKIEVGLRADILIIGRDGENPYDALIDATASDVRLVLIDGEAHFGDENLSETARNEVCEDFDVCGNNKFICVSDPDSTTNLAEETLTEIHDKIYSILEGLPEAPPEEQYGRGDELLPLVNCK
ncbi:MAG: amidohydrolase family protein [Myxococcota bacterium]